MSDVTHHAAANTRSSPPLVGRTAERVLLSEQLSATQAGRGNLVIIGGEAGIGKTTIARDLVANARERAFLAVVGHCYDLTATPPYGLWLDVAESYRHTATSENLPSPPEVLANRQLDAITTQSAFFGEVAAFLQAVVAVQPAVVIFEDVQWADPVSLELLRHVSARVSQVPLLLVVTYREDELTRQNPFYQQLPALVRESEGLRLNLKRLTRADLGSLVTQHYELPDGDQARLVEYLAAHTDGNPFFTMELLRALEEQEAGLDPADGRWTLGELDRIVVPRLVRQVIDGRVARLGEPVREILMIAAVIGQEVSIDLLRQIAGVDEETLYGVIDRTIEWHVLMPTPDGTAVQFVHALTREALYEAMPPHRCHALHRAMAEALEAVPSADPDAIAYHYQQANDPRAPAWLTKAGDRAQRAYAWLTAKDRFATAARLLENVPGAEGTRARLLYRCGRLQRYSNADAAIDSLRMAVRLAEIAGDQVLTGDATYSQGLVQCFADVWKPGLANMNRGGKTLESLPPEQAYVSWATAHWMADALPTVEEPFPLADTPAGILTAIGPSRHQSVAWFLAAGGYLGEAVEVATSYRSPLPAQDAGPLAVASAGHAEFGHGMALASLGDPEGAHLAFANVRDIYLQLDHHAVLAFVDITEMIDVMIPYRTNDPAGRQRLAHDAAIAIDRARGAIPTEVMPNRAHLVNMYLDGSWHEARQIAAACRVHGTYVFRRLVTHTLGPIAYHQGDTDETWTQILALLPQGYDTEPGSAVLLDALMLQRLAVHLCLDASDLDSADRWLDANERWLTWSGSALGRAENHLVWAERHLAAGDIVTAGKRANQAVAAASTPLQPLALLQSRRLSGDLARRCGNMERAEEALTTSLILATRCQIPFERSRSLLALAHLQATSDRPAARALGIEALEISRALGVAALAEQVERLLADLSGADRFEVPAGLTGRELGVLRLVAQGMTDAEVGAALSISPRTVSQHLRSVYSKLTVRSRLEATRYAMNHGLV